VSASKAKGTRWENEVRDLYRRHGFVTAERLALGGTLDRGDITGVGPLTIEAKNHRSMSLAAWIDEAEREAINAGYRFAVVHHHRVGKAGAADGYATLRGDTFAALWRCYVDALDGRSVWKAQSL
jgi:hypothetical protein